jgi:hypothetical protein
MDSRQWRETLRGDLLQQNLPAAYIDRLVDELSDHLIDTQRENPSMEAQQASDRLGTTKQLAAVARHEFCRTTFAARHPYLSFVIGPIALVPVLYVSLLLGPYLILATLAIPFDLATGNTPFQVSEESSTLSSYWIACCYHHFFRFVPFALAACIFSYWGRKAGMRRWAIVACGIVAAWAGATVSSVRPVDNGLAAWMFGLALKPSFNQLFQLLVPLAIAAWFLLRAPQRLLPIGLTPNAAAN